MITVEIKINDDTIRSICAKRIEELTDENKEYTYQVFKIEQIYDYEINERNVAAQNDTIELEKDTIEIPVGVIKHKYSDGVVALAEKLLPFMRNSKGK